jgi:hypothetical protein
MDAETLAMTLAIIREQTDGDEEAYEVAVENLKQELEGTADE